MKRSSLTIVSLVTLGLSGAFAIGQAPAPAETGPARVSAAAKMP